MLTVGVRNAFDSKIALSIMTSRAYDRAI